MNKIKKVGKFVCVILIILMGSLIGYLSAISNLEVQVMYGAEGTTQSSGMIEYGNINKQKIYNREEKAENNSIRYVIRCKGDKVDLLQIRLGDCGGTIYINKVYIKYNDEVLSINKDDIEKYFTITGAETAKIGEKYFEIFTYNAHDAKLTGKRALFNWINSIRIQDNKIVITKIIDNIVFYYEIVILLVLFLGGRQKQFNSWIIKHKRTADVILYGMTFAIYFVRLLAQNSMVAGQGDSISIWGTITSYYTNNVQPSYVLYKGMFSVYPYVWLYRLACIFGANEFLFIKIYNALLFAYIAAIGMPTIFEKIFDEKNILLWKKWLFVICIFNLQVVNVAYFRLSVDIPSLFWFVLMMDISVHIWKGKKEKYLLEILGIGIAAGIVFCFSGQFLLAGVLEIVFAVIVVTKKKNIKQTFLCIIFIVIGVLGIKEINNYFITKVVDPMRTAGEWLPYGEEWIVNAFCSEKPFLGSAYMSQGNFYDTQVIQIISEEKPQYTGDMSTGEIIVKYFSTMFKHPVEFLISCGNKLFLAFCMDTGTKYKFVSLGLGFLLFFIGMLKMTQRYLGKLVIDKMEYLIGVAFFFTILIPCALHMELRYAMAIQDYIFGFGIFGTNIRTVLKIRQDETGIGTFVLNKQCIGILLSGVLFVMFCIMHYMALLD